MEYKQSKMELKDFEGLRQKIKKFWIKIYSLYWLFYIFECLNISSLIYIKIIFYIWAASVFSIK